MPIIAKSNKKDFTPAPEGLHSAVCCDVVDLGLQKYEYQGKTIEQYKVEIRWQLEDQDPKTNKPFMVSRRFTLSLHEKSHLRPMLEAWRGRKFTKEELDGFDLERLVGVNCQVQVIHNIKDEGEVYANVQAVVPPAKGAPALRVDAEYVRMSERERRAQLEANPDGYRATNDDCPF